MFDKLRHLELTFKQRPLFDNICGYENYKQIFTRSLNAKKPVHILMLGAPATGKTEFLLNIKGHKDYRKRTLFAIGSSASKAGILDQLFTERPRYLCIDEIEHMSITDKTVLLSLMETGIISENKIRKTRETQLKTWVFATTNHLDKIPDALLTRFLILKFKPYTKQQFIDVAFKIMTEQEDADPDFAKVVAAMTYDMLGNSTNPRNCKKVVRLANNEADARMILEAMQDGSEAEEGDGYL